MKPFVVAVNAVSGGGKTAITTALHKRLLKSQALYFDDRNYDIESGIDDICSWIENGSDVNLFNLTPLADDIMSHLNRKINFIILDYPFGYRHKQIAGFINYSIFIDTPLDVALARRILRDYNQDSISSIFSDMAHYLERGRNAYLQGLESVKETADFVVDGSLPIDIIIDIICDKLQDTNNAVNLQPHII